MKLIIVLLLAILPGITAYSQAISQKRQPISYNGILSDAGNVIKNSRVSMIVSILKGSAGGTVIYTEHHLTGTDTAGRYQIEIGRGKQVAGQFDSIIWSDGIFYLKTEIDPLGGNNYKIVQNILMRIPPELSNQYEQGTASFDHPEWGEWHFKNSRNKRPKLVTVDLTTSYANLAYPANTYPIYRHYEWCDPDMDGIGNSFSISFSDNTNNEFKENTTKLGEVKLYATPFQDISISSTNQEIIVSITKPVPVLNLGESYAVKGPCKFIYYIEW